MDDAGENIDKKAEAENRQRFLAGAYIVGLSGLSAVVAGIVAGKIAKRKSNEYYKDLKVEPKVVLENPTLLALRALAWSTVISVGFCSLAIFGCCKWAGINNLDDLREKVRKFKKPSVPSDERTNFENLQDFLTYLSERFDSKSKEKAKECTEKESK